MFILRFDFRRPASSPASITDLYATALDMASWGEANGAMMAMFSEHHAASDDYLPSPLLLASAAAARTTTLPINVGALLLLMYDPVKLAEDIAVLDHLSNGRVSYTIGLGYRDEEYAMFGIDRTRRGTLIEERIDVLRRALAGEQFEWQGRQIDVRPHPRTPDGPTLAYGGGSVAAARRAARLGLMLLPQTSDPTLLEAYDAEAERSGTTPGLVMAPAEGAPTSVFIATDPDRGWADMGPYLLHDARMYAAWMGADSNSASLSTAAGVDELREANGAYRIVDPDQAVDLVNRYGVLSMQPLCGGMPPDLAWTSLHAYEQHVAPRLG
ncbi:MAG: LLM class flavin-dependent oxidoreductase [Acidimicrobiales bacterium]|nr:LLM class flavin-dependent oxidoreductase [Acidimicrobiales bacterium]